ncbi:unnamed protein product, partial [Iphiclides podalirius]
MTSSDQLLDVEALGFGLNTDPGQLKELQYAGLERRASLNDNYYSAFIDCVETKILTCFRDIGGPVIYDNQLAPRNEHLNPNCRRGVSKAYLLRNHRPPPPTFRGLNQFASPKGQCVSEAPASATPDSSSLRSK